MTERVPRGPEDQDCPLTLSRLGGPKKMSEVCHRCPLWMQIPFEHPVTGAPIVEWNCGLAWEPIVQMKHAQVSHRTFKYVEALRNEVVGAVTAQASHMAGLKESVERLIVGVAEAADRGLLKPSEPKQLEARNAEEPAEPAA